MPLGRAAVGPGAGSLMLSVQSGSSVPQRREGPSPGGPLPHPRGPQPSPPPVTQLSPGPAALSQFQVLFLPSAGPSCKRGGQWSVRFRQLSSRGEDRLFWGMSTAGGVAWGQGL